MTLLIKQYSEQLISNDIQLKIRMIAKFYYN